MLSVHISCSGLTSGFPSALLRTGSRVAATRGNDNRPHETIPVHPSGADKRNSLAGCACGAPVSHGRDARATIFCAMTSLFSAVRGKFSTANFGS
jgi:hypothetical protein